MSKKNTWKKDKLGRNLLVSKNKDNKTIYRSLSLEKLFKDGVVSDKVVSYPIVSYHDYKK
jgi:hypothetical protein